MEYLDSALGLSKSTEYTSHVESASFLAIIAMFTLSYTHTDWNFSFTDVCTHDNDK